MRPGTFSAMPPDDTAAATTPAGTTNKKVQINAYTDYWLWLTCCSSTFLCKRLGSTCIIQRQESVTSTLAVPMRCSGRETDQAP